MGITKGAPPKDGFQIEGAVEATNTLWHSLDLSFIRKPAVIFSRPRSSSPSMYVAVLPFHLTHPQICCTVFSGVSLLGALCCHFLGSKGAVGRRRRWPLPMAQEPMMH